MNISPATPDDRPIRHFYFLKHSPFKPIKLKGDLNALARPSL